MSEKLREFSDVAHGEATRKREVPNFCLTSGNYKMIGLKSRWENLKHDDITRFSLL